MIGSEAVSRYTLRGKAVNHCSLVSLRRFLLCALLIMNAGFLIPFPSHSHFPAINYLPSLYSHVDHLIRPPVIPTTDLPNLFYKPDPADNIHPRCLSRSHLPLLRDIDNFVTDAHYVPPLLAQTWDSYDQLHFRCSNNLRSGLLHEGCKYLLFSDARLCGLGNRLASLASAITYAIATDHALLLDNRRNLGDLLCEPFSHHNRDSSWLLPPDSPYHSLIDKAPSTAAYVLVKRNKTAAHESFHEDSGSLVKVSLWNEDPGDGDLQFFTEDVYRMVAEAKWVVWESDLYTIPNLFLVSPFWQRMRDLFAHKEDKAFALITHLAILPSDNVWTMVLKEYSGYLAGATKRVGVQIRLHGLPDRAMYDEGAMDMIMNCLTDSEYLPRPLNLNQSSATEMASLYMERILREKNSHVEQQQQQQRLVDVAILVASLQSQYFLKMKEIYSEGRGTEDGRVVRVHTVSSLKTQDFTFRQAQLALAEMWLLSFSHHLAISASSTCHLPPLILRFINENSLHCKQGYSSDPCSHLRRAPLQFQASNLSPTHQKWILHHLRACQDRPGAWQLVQSHVPPHTALPIFSM